MPYEGSCHCGAVAIEVAGEVPREAMSCNCSHCRRKGFLLAFVPASDVVLSRGAEELETYTFNTHKLRHRFCRTCGVQPFAEGRSQDGADIRAVNLRCIPALDLDGLKIDKVNGAAF